MKKFLSVLFAALLLIALALPAFAGYTQGVAMTAEEQANIDAIADAILSRYGVEAYFLYNTELEDGTLKAYTLDFAETVGEKAIIFTVSETSYYLYVSSAAVDKTSVSADDQDDLYDACREADERGEYYNMAVQYYAALNSLLAQRAQSTLNGNVPSLLSSESYRLMDGAQLLSTSEREALLAKLDEISERQQFDVIVRTVDDFPGSDIADWAEAWYDASDFGFGTGKDGCMLTISMAERDWCITSTGFGETALDPYCRDYIGDAILSDLSDGDYADAFTGFANYVDEFVTQAKTGEPYSEHNHYKEPFNAGKRIVIAIIIGIVVSGIVTLSVKSSYKPVKLQSGAADYMVPGSLQMTGSYDRFMYNNVTRTKKASSSSSGGGSSTSSSGRSSSGKF